MIPDARNEPSLFGCRCNGAFGRSVRGVVGTILQAWLVWALLAGFGSSGQAGVRPEVDVEIINRSSRDLENATARFGQHACGWGWVIRNATKGYGFYPHPITAEAKLHWDQEGKHRVETLDLRKTYPPGKSGRLTFTVYDDRVEVSFRERS
jgi:hypothetical protein